MRPSGANEWVEKNPKCVLNFMDSTRSDDSIVCVGIVLSKWSEWSEWIWNTLSDRANSWAIEGIIDVDTVVGMMCGCDVRLVVGVTED